MSYQKVAIISANNNSDAEEKKNILIKKYNFTDLNKLGTYSPEFDLIIVLGGDGMMLHLMHKYEKNPLPLYGINCGTVGFLMNDYAPQNLPEIINNSKASAIRPLRMTAVTSDDETFSSIAINEVSLLRQLSQASKINIRINGHERLACLTADGIIVATPAGSTAYNLSLRGPIIPFSSKMLAMTPISPFRPRNWPGAILPSNSIIEFNIIDHQNRPVSATADFIEVRNVKKVLVQEDPSLTFTLLFNPSHSLEERITREQFVGHSESFHQG